MFNSTSTQTINGTTYTITVESKNHDTRFPVAKIEVIGITNGQYSGYAENCIYLPIRAEEAIAAETERLVKQAVAQTDYQVECAMIAEYEDMEYGRLFNEDMAIRY